MNLGRILARRGDFSEAEELVRKSLACMREIGHRHVVVTSLHNLGAIVSAQGDFTESERLYRESLSIAREIGIDMRRREYWALSEKSY